MYKIDDFDLKILTLLQANGRLTNQELSDLIGLSASQCSRRRIALEQAQLILGYHARLAPNAQVSLYPWKEPAELVPLAVRHIRTFLKANRP